MYMTVSEEKALKLLCNEIFNLAQSVAMQSVLMINQLVGMYDSCVV